MWSAVFCFQPLAFFCLLAASLCFGYNHACTCIHVLSGTYMYSWNFCWTNISPILATFALQNISGISFRPQNILLDNHFAGLWKQEMKIVIFSRGENASCASQLMSCNNTVCMCGWVCNCVCVCARVRACTRVYFQLYSICLPHFCIPADLWDVRQVS